MEAKPDVARILRPFLMPLWYPSLEKWALKTEIIKLDEIFV